MKQWCPSCRKVTEHNVIVENKSFSQKIHSVCIPCGHSNQYKERSSVKPGMPIIREWKRK